MNLCSFGCGREAITQFRSSGKYCCSKSPNSCPAKKTKVGANISKKRNELGDSYWKNGHPKGASGGTSLKGKSYEEIYGKDEAIAKKSKLSEKMKGFSSWNKLSSEQQNEIRENSRKQIIARYEDGWMPKAGRCKKYTYDSPIAGTVKLDGTWELTTARWLDMKSYVWYRNTKRFEYINLKGLVSHYTPDFYVETIGYVEVKGYKTKLDECKWSQFNEPLTVWYRDTIETFKEELVGWQSGNAADC